MGKKNGGIRMKQIGPKGGGGTNAAAAAAAASMLTNPMDAFTNIPPEDMVHIMPPPDRTYQVFWPLHETFSMNITKFQIIYPSYIDSTKTTKLGRRIPKPLAVTNPTVLDISHALSSLNIKHVVQPYKGYSRDITVTWDNPGRVKVDIQSSSNIFQNKKQLMIKLCEIIPTLSERVKRIQQQTIQTEKEYQQKLIAIEAEQEKEKANSTSTAMTTTSGTTSTGTVSSTNKKITNNKKGKRK